EELDSSIFHVRVALALCPKRHRRHSDILDNLGRLLCVQFEQCRRIEDLEEAIKHLRAALRLRPDGHSRRSASLHSLAISLQIRIEQHRQTAELDEAIELNRAALQLLPGDHPKRSAFLINLASSLQIRSVQQGQTADLDEAIEHNRTALQLLQDTHPNRSRSLNNLAHSLVTRFEQCGQAADLDVAIEHHRASLQLLPGSHPDYSGSLNDLANSLTTRFSRYGQLADLDEAIEQHRVALQLRPGSHPDRSASFNNLANSLATRFIQHRHTADLDEAIEYHRAALQLRPVGHPNRSSSLNNLGISLQTRFKQHGQTADLDEAIEYHRAALKLFPDGHPNRSKSLNNLADFLLTRFEQHGWTVDLNEAIDHSRAALQLQPDSHSDRSGSLSILARSLSTRFKQHGQIAELDEAIEYHRAALQLRPDGHPGRSESLTNLASSLFLRFRKFGLMDNFEESLQTLEHAAEHEFSSFVIRLSSAMLWFNLARNHAHHTVSRAYKVAILLLQRALIVSPTLHTQHDFLRGTGSYGQLTSDAVAYAVEEGRLEEAIEMLEQGRGLLWSQMRGFRTPLDRLAGTNRGLADRCRNVSQQLENLATSTTLPQSDSSMAGNGLSLKLKRQLSIEQEELINEIRQVPGYESFLATTPFKVLQQAASEGPVIVINFSRYRCDVLVVLSCEDLPVVSIPLDEGFFEDSIKSCADLWEWRQRFTAGSPGYDERLVKIMKMLWDRVVSKVVDKLREIGIAEESRIWWCPTSMLSALPFHAAGPFKGEDGTIKYLLDSYVSSYTPTLGALIDARSRESQADPAMLIVGDTKTLVSTEKEVRAIRGHTRSYVPSRTILLNERANRERVLQRLQDVTWIHFACHGHLGSYPKPFDSSFQLSDGALTLLDIIRANLPNAEFAFLSACHTAEQHPSPSIDENIHLAAAMQFCGFRSVIGTLWEMYDPDGPLLAKEVYSYMVDHEDGEVRYKRSAAALRNAVLVLRRQDGVQTERWVNLVHIGA
ncbi:TPR-like protein, partial [Fomitiporia mediterranea MF3/22]|uniref:TPR-like protein n=1 Tax=Fomitiporia mediterranea (strain MF3/22) TaxID=694068 RepID=UPI0004407913